MPVHPINSHADFTRIINSGKVVVVDFWATWCGPCRVISPVLEQHAEKTPSIEFYKVDVDEQPDIAQEVGVRAMPTFAVFYNGQKVDDLVGANPGGLQQLERTFTTI
ncbi:thioredoxin [Russula dissimulans]|nr:thioredoxin [Russula dissimulans]